MTIPLLTGKRQVSLSKEAWKVVWSHKRRLWLISAVTSGLEYKSFKKVSMSLFPKADVFKALRAWQLVLKGILVLISTLQSQPSSLVFNRSFDRAWHSLYCKGFPADWWRSQNEEVKIPCSPAPQQITWGFLLHLSSCADESPRLSATSRD